MTLVDSGIAWLGAIPQGWTVKPAKALFTNPSEPSRPSDVHLTPSQKYGVLPQSEYMETTGSRVVLNLTGADYMKHVEAGDFISHLRSFQGGLEYSNLSGKVSNAYTVLRPRREIRHGFYRWLFKSSLYVQGLQTTTDQLRDGQSIRFGQFALLPLPEPPLAEQKAIAEFLDRETAQIDNLIAKQEQLIATLRERRASVIHNAVSKGLSPETEMISVNTTWLSYMPVQWNLVTLKRNAYIKARVGWKGMTSDEFEVESFAYLVTGRDFSSRTIDLRECYQVSQERFADDPFIQLRKGDLLVTKDGSIGKTALVGELDKPACLNSGVFLVRAAKNCQNSFLYWVLNSNVFNEFIALQASGSTIQHLYQNVFETFKFGLPSLEEQEEIVGYLEGETARIDELISKAKELNLLLKTRRQALISAAVTGKISVGA